MFKQGDKVRYSADGRVGEITGKYREKGDAWQVMFNGVDLIYIPAEKLSPYTPCLDVYDYYQHEDFQSISDFRRRMYRYRMSGELTNLMYSMDNAVAEFMPHQFIPVVKFLESYTDRLLIADEVGLGKTIEAMYIWEELRARKNAKRLLVVVPAVLRDKWKGDMRKFFGIDADIVSAQGKGGEKTLLRCMNEVLEDQNRSAFALIVSLEGIRTSSEVRKVLEACRDSIILFDMVIIDEAHYLRNSETEGFKTGELLRDASRHLVLLSATPIQTSSNNFFNLLNLLAPEDYSFRETFDQQLLENKPLVELANALERGSQSSVLRPLVDEALRNEVFRDDDDLNRLSAELESVASDMRERVVMIDHIKEKYFYSGLVTRSRKRDVFPNRTQRVVTSVNFKLNEYERKFYEEVSRYLRLEGCKITRANDFSVFRLIARQRQMASCIPAALQAWRGLGVDDDFDETCAEESGKNAARFTGMPQFEEYDLTRLEQEDSKFTKVLTEINGILAKNPREKIIIFSFFRNTVRYLHDKLHANGISSSYIMGGLSLEEKTERIKTFAETSLNVLVSSEVGSEGIDLQFARYELNYDLPWNPMRLEQRIGRIDRIGQESDKIYIGNAYCENTIEDRILQRLYQRIEIFRMAIGDLEEVLGEQILNLEMNVFREAGELSEEEINARAEQVVSAVCHQQEVTKNLELEVGNMVSPYQEFILKNIGQSYKSNRRMTSEELMFFCKDILEEKFRGSSVTMIEGSSLADVRLSDLGRRELTRYVGNNPSAVGTSLNSSPAGLRCNFGKRVIGKNESSVQTEFIDVNHPLVRWLRSVVEENALFTTGCEIVSINNSDIPEEVHVAPGYYAYAVQRWRANGVKNVNELRYLIAPGIHGEPDEATIMNPQDAERILVSVVMHGRHYDATLLPPEEYEACGMALQAVSEQMDEDFWEFSEEQKKRNKDLVEEQSKYVERTASIKAGRIQQVINKMKAEQESALRCGDESRNHASLIKANEKRRDNVLDRCEQRLMEIEEKLDCTSVNQDVAVGILYVQEG